MKQLFFRFLMMAIVLAGTWQYSMAQATFDITLDRINSNEIGTSTIELTNGNILIAGRTENALNQNSNQDAFLAEIDQTTGTVVWSTAYGWNGNDGFTTVIQASNGDIIA